MRAAAPHRHGRRGDDDGRRRDRPARRPARDQDPAARARARPLAGRRPARLDARRSRPAALSREVEPGLALRSDARAVAAGRPGSRPARGARRRARRRPARRRGVHRRLPGADDVVAPGSRSATPRPPAGTSSSSTAGPLDAAVAPRWRCPAGLRPAASSGCCRWSAACSGRWGTGRCRAGAAGAVAAGVVEAVERLHGGARRASASCSRARRPSARLVRDRRARRAAAAARARAALALPASPSTAWSSTGSFPPTGDDPWLRGPRRRPGRRCSRTPAARSPPARRCEARRAAGGTWPTARGPGRDPASTLHGDDCRCSLAEPGPPHRGAGPRWNSDGDAFVLVLALPGRPARRRRSSPAAGTSCSSTSRERGAVPLPSVLRRCEVTGAALRDGELRVAFRPDPALWRSL